MAKTAIVTTSPSIGRPGGGIPGGGGPLLGMAVAEALTINRTSKKMLGTIFIGRKSK